MIDLNYGRLAKNNLIEYAPAGMSPEQLEANGYKRIIKTQKPLMAGSNDNSKSWQFVGYEEVNGELRKKYELRERRAKPVKYSKRAIFQNVEDKYGPKDVFMKNILQANKDVYDEIESHDVYVQGCQLLDVAISAFAVQFGISEDEVVAQIINPSRIG